MKINGNELHREMAGAYRVTIDGRTFRIVGSRNEWAALESYGSMLNTKLGTFTSLREAARALAAHTFKIGA
jgi:hypothetical protein